MAREDTHWFVVGVVALSFILFLVLPLSALIYIDHLRTREEVRAEIRDLKILKRQLKKDLYERANPTVDDTTK